MDDRTVGALAISACVGAWFAWALPLPRLLIVVGAFVAIMARRPRLLIVFVGLWSSVSGAASLAALRIPPPVGRFTGTVMLMSDPVPVTFGARVDVRVNGRRYEAFVDRVQSRVLMAHLTGESMVVEGTFAAYRPADAPWLDARHIAARLEIDRIVGWKPAPLMYRIANRVHDALAAGATPLPFDQRALYTGLVYGDDRGQRAVLVDDFRAGGLGHLLAVSGQNVAFVLTAAGPVLRRVSYRVRWPATLVVLAVFVLVTRAEPSVLRAAAMAAVATWASTHGRVAPGLRVLFLAVGTLVLVDPLLVRAVGFQLSVAASLGIIWLGPRLTARVPGPRPVAELLGVTFAAQATVAPIAVATFGSIPLASIPANLLALPAAGPVMVWGLTGGVVAGALDGRLGRVLQLPTLGALRWITAVAAASGRAPLGALRLSHVVWLAAAFVALAGLSRLATTRGEVWPAGRGR